VNHLLGLERLHNSYYVMRHGRSLANERGLIVSHPDNGCDGYGLADAGREQVRQSLRARNDLGADLRIVSSDFLRARESAEIAASMLGCTLPPSLEPRLRERDFGEYELGSDDAYENVWQEDCRDAQSRLRGVESVNQVMARVTRVVCDLEQALRDTAILLVSHGDALQILQTAFAGRDASAHRELEHLHTAEIRQLKLRAK